MLVQVIFCLEEKTRRRSILTTGFSTRLGRLFNSTFACSDVCTIHGPSSIYHLWKAFDINSNGGGACREIIALKSKYGEKLLNLPGLSAEQLCNGASFLTSRLTTQWLRRTSSTRCLTSLTNHWGPLPSRLTPPV